MYADVYLLRYRGQKLPKSRIFGIRGRLRIERGLTSAEGDAARISMTASVHTRWPQPYPGHAEATLYGAVVTRLDERGFVIVGREVVSSGLGAVTYPQAWACVPVLDAASAPTTPQAPGQS